MKTKGTNQCHFTPQPGRILGEFGISSLSRTDTLEFHFCNCSSLGINVLWPLLGILLSKVKYLHLKRIGVFLTVLLWAMSIYCFCEHYGLERRNTCCVLC